MSNAADTATTADTAAVASARKHEVELLARYFPETDRATIDRIVAATYLRLDAVPPRVAYRPSIVATA